MPASNHIEKAPKTHTVAKMIGGNKQ